MNKDDMLSQEEIDALLNGGGSDEQSDAPELLVTEDTPSLDEFLSPIEIDAIGELGNISFSNSATALSTLLNQKVEITTPTVNLVTKDDLEEEFPAPHVAVLVDYVEGFQGLNLLIIQNHDAAVIADLMLGGDGQSPNIDLGEIQLSAIQEAMNQMMGSAATSLSTFFDKRIDISPPKTVLLDVASGAGIEYVPNQDIFIKVSFQLKVGNLIDSSIMQILTLDFAKTYVQELLSKEKSEENESKVKESEQSMSNHVDNRSAKKEFTEPKTNQSSSKKKIEHVETAQFADFEEPHYLDSNEQRNLDLLMDIPLNVSVELGRTRKSIKEILELNSGSIVELDKLAGEPVDILINNQLIAKGEVVVIDENFGVRVTDIINQAERIKKLR
ncbi:flagellar motor switch phosphatase FliY [Bacillaceae bacterium W0354]